MGCGGRHISKDPSGYKTKVEVFTEPIQQAAADSRSRSRNRGAGAMCHMRIRYAAYDATRCAAVLLIRESIQGFPCIHEAQISVLRGS